MNEQDVSRYLDQLPKTQDAPPEPELTVAAAAILAGLKPVRPMPGIPALVGLIVLTVAAITGLAIWWRGAEGLAALTTMERVILLPALGCILLLVSYAVAVRMLPGHRERLPVYSLSALLIVPIVGVVVTLFHLNLRVGRAIPLGEHCLTYGLLVATAAALCVGLVMRWGFAVDRFAAAIGLSAVAAASALLVLTIYCPLQNVAHVLVWHFGSAAISMAAGATWGWLRR